MVNIKIVRGHLSACNTNYCLIKYPQFIYHNTEGGRFWREEKDGNSNHPAKNK